MYKWVIAASVVMLAVSCAQKEPGENDASCQDKTSEEELASIQKEAVGDSVTSGNASMQAPAGEITVQVFENTEANGTGGFGYDLIADGKPMIHQPHIPAISGLKGFASKADAEKAGMLMKYKIENGIMPPTISMEELDSLKILR
jgi:hypothetical protein